MAETVQNIVVGVLGSQGFWATYVGSLGGVLVVPWRWLWDGCDCSECCGRCPGFSGFLGHICRQLRGSDGCTIAVAMGWLRLCRMLWQVSWVFRASGSCMWAA